MSPAPRTTLLSAQEAKEKLEAIIEDFFFRRLKIDASNRIEYLLVKSPPGLGKTKEAIDGAVRYQTKQETSKSILDGMSLVDRI